MVRTTLATAALAVLGASSLVGASNLGQRWLSSWATMPQLTEPANLPSPPFNQTGVVFPNSTIRQSFKVSLPGAQFRLRFSNVFSDVDLSITAVTVALPGNRSAVGTPDIDTSTLHTVTFDGNKGFEVPNGALVVSDTINWPVAENSILTVSLYLAGGQPSPSNSITSHPGSRTTSYYDFGDLTRAKNISSPTAQNAAHWYFLSRLEVVSADPTSYAVAIVGDSITDGRGSTTNGNDRWPDQFYNRLRARRRNNVSYLNQAAGGNRILADGLGPNALGRIDRDVLAQTRVGSVIIFEGVNDIGVAAPDAASQAAITARVIAAFKQIATRVHAQDKPIYGATITPFGGNTYDAPEREKSRQAINTFIRTSGTFDAVIDFDAVVRNPKNTSQLDPRYDSGDGLHPNATGYHAMAQSINLALFP